MRPSFGTARRAASHTTISTRSAREGGSAAPRWRFGLVCAALPRASYWRAGLAWLILVAGALGLALASAIAADDKANVAKESKETGAKEIQKPATSAAAPAPAATAAKPAAKPAESLPPLKGSHIKEDDNSCFACHSNIDPKDKDVGRFFIDPAALKKDVHYQNGVNCSDCHGGDASVLEPTAHQAKSDFHFQARDIIASRCAHCHEREMIGLNAGVHASAGQTNNPMQPTVLSCAACHGEVVDGRRTLTHSLLPVSDQKSPVHLEHQVQLCGDCHVDKRKTYLESVHGQGLVKMGLVNVPVCADCHSAHDILRATQSQSTLSRSRVADTCAKCHRFLKERLLESVHGRGGVLGGKADRPAPGGKTTQLPSCTDCHQGHDLPAPESTAFRESLPDRCGNCHRDMSGLFALSMHGKLTTLGYGPAAKCADCHGSHGILPPDDPRSTLSAANRPMTCGQCHANARGNFVYFNPHLDPLDPNTNRLVYGVQVTLLTLLYTTFGFFGLHCVLWLIRGLVEVFRHGRPHGLRPGETAYVRFISFHRIGHTIMMSSFLGLALTGLPLKYSKMPWAQTLARHLGGFGSTSFWHRFFGVILLVSMAAYLTRMVRLLILGRRKGHSLRAMIFGPDSPVPNIRDLKDFLKMMRWFFGLGPKPGMERWAYWEKIDFWGAIADTVIIGTTGLVLWFPTFFAGTLHLPGTGLNIAQVIHSTQALLATGFVFAIHFFNTHMRPDKFPADMSVLSGLVSEHEFKDERPDYFERLQREGRLDALRTAAPGLFVIWCIRLFGFAALATGLALLVGMVLASFG